MEKYFKFDGSVARSEFWGINIIVGILASFLAVVGVVLLGTSTGSIGLTLGSILLFGALIVAAWISLATAVKRCRNAGLNVWWAAATCIPYIGSIVFIVLGCLKTDNE